MMRVLYAGNLIFDSGESMIDATFTFGYCPHLHRGARWVWWIVGDGGIDFDRWCEHGKEFDSCNWDGDFDGS